MAQLRQDYKQFQAAGAEVIVVGPDGRLEFEEYWQEKDLPFLGIPDPEHLVLDRYGQEFKLLRMGRMPAQAVIDQEGVLRYIHYGNAMTDIPSSDEMLAVLEKLQVEAERGEARS
jgi:peroxiredoxin